MAPCDANERIRELEGQVRALRDIAQRILEADDAAIADLKQCGVVEFEDSRGLTEELRAALAASPAPLPPNHVRNFYPASPAPVESEPEITPVSAREIQLHERLEQARQFLTLLRRDADDCSKRMIDDALEIITITTDDHEGKGNG